MYNGYCGGGFGWNREAVQQPPVNIKETESEYILHLYAPSLKKEASTLLLKVMCFL